MEGVWQAYTPAMPHLGCGSRCAGLHLQWRTTSSLLLWLRGEETALVSFYRPKKLRGYAYVCMRGK